MNTVIKFAVWLIYASLFYLTCSLIMWDFDISRWHVVIRFLFAVFQFWLVLETLTYKFPKHR